MGNDSEFYHKDGVDYDRPTKMLDYFNPPELVDWKVKTPPADVRRISRLALKHGGRIDDLIREGKTPKKSDDQEVKSCYAAWIKWRKDYSVEDEDIEFPETYFDEELRVAGTADIYWKSRKMIIDVKSAKRLHEGYLFQVGGFYSRDPKYEVKEIGILRLDKEIEGYELITNTDLRLPIKELQYGFICLMGYYRAFKMVQSTLKPKEKVYDRNSCDAAE